jgi:hypothetical protein
VVEIHMPEIGGFILKGPDDGVYHSELCFLDFAHRPVLERMKGFGNWICFHPQVRGKGETEPGLRYLYSYSYTDVGCPVIEVNSF